MNKRVGHDHLVHNRFRIVNIDSATDTVEIKYEKNDWLRGFELTNRMTATEFLSRLIDGRFEIERRPAFAESPP